MITEQRFGGIWTEHKLANVSSYLSAYAKAMKRQSFTTFYVDAFAGTGYRSLKKRTKNNKNQQDMTLEFPEFAEVETIKFLEGSARKALQVIPRFKKYYFIEKAKGNFKELEKLKQEF